MQLSLNDDWVDLTNRLGGSSAASKLSVLANTRTSVAPPTLQQQQQPTPFHLDLPSVDFHINFLEGLHVPSSIGDNHQATMDLSSTLKQIMMGLEASLADVPALALALPVVGIRLMVFYNMALMAPDEFRQGMEPYRRGNYDPVQAKAFYSRHKLLVIQRASQVFRLSNGFFAGILFDKYILRDEERNRAQRAQELLTLVTNLGPTAIKIGQALSVRPDLIPEEYAKALSTLQDSVPPFDGKAAKEILRRELGQEKYSHLKDFPFMTKNSGPVASASIGQGMLCLLKKHMYHCSTSSTRSIHPEN